MTSRSAWYCAKRAAFAEASVEDVVRTLSHAASSDGWHVEKDQHQEWEKSVELLQSDLSITSTDACSILQKALASPALDAFTDVILEYDFRRRGLRIDAVLFAPGLIVVLEFKRSRLGSSDRDQVTNYCINLVEFHEETRRLCNSTNVVVIPVLALTEGTHAHTQAPRPEFYSKPWEHVARHPIQCDAPGLRQALEDALTMRRSQATVTCSSWLESRFSPSSTILDAAISLYGQHDVSAIEEHAAPAKRIQDCTEEVAQHIITAKTEKRNRIIFVSGTPGAGKTLVGLNLAFDSRFRRDAVFVTGMRLW